MTALTLITTIAAPPQRCFDLARSMEFHSISFASTGERIIGGRAQGLIQLNEEVEFEARHLGMTRRLRVRITRVEPPHRFIDEQVRGPFRTLRHEHLFEAIPEGTRQTDRITFDPGYGVLGLLAERIAIAPHMRRLVGRHQQNLKRALESDEWRRYFIT